MFVLDDVDRAGVELRAALGALVEGLAGLPALVVATAVDPAFAPAPGAAALLVLGPLGADAVHAVAQLYAGAVETWGSRSSGSLRRAEVSRGVCTAPPASGASGGCAAPGPRGRTGGERTHGPARGRGRPRRRRRAAAGGAGTRRAGGHGREVIACPSRDWRRLTSRDAELFFGRERLWPRWWRGWRVRP